MVKKNTLTGSMKGGKEYTPKKKGKIIIIKKWIKKKLQEIRTQKNKKRKTPKNENSKKVESKRMKKEEKEGKNSKNWEFNRRWKVGEQWRGSDVKGVPIIKSTNYNVTLKEELIHFYPK